jgi:hypothetical protein
MPRSVQGAVFGYLYAAQAIVFHVSNPDLIFLDVALHLRWSRMDQAEYTIKTLTAGAHR